MASNELMGYGIAVNFLGNYQREGNAINQLTERLNTGLSQLKSLVIGGAITTALYKFGNNLMTFARTMEQNFANLKSTLGSTAKALSTLEWARKKGASTPFEIQEVNNAVGTMTTLGFNKNDDMREKVFNSVGDFAALRGFDFADMMQRVAKASFGNWESLGDQFGIRRQTIGNMAREQMARTPEKFKGQESDIQKAIQMVEKGKQGTEEYRMAIVELIGVLGKGGMENRLNTIAGAMSNIDDITSNFMMNIVGYTQLQGTLSNAIKNTLVDGILKPFSNTHKVLVDGIYKEISAVDQLGVIGQGVGEILKGVWGMVDGQIKNSSNFIISYIDKLYVFFNDFQNNIAPIVLFLALVRLEVEDFISGFYEGFSSTFKWFITASVAIWKIFGDLVKWLGITDLKAKDIGKTLGMLMGAFLGFKAFKFITSPLHQLDILLGNALPKIGSVLQGLDKVIFKGRIIDGLNRIASGNVNSGLTLIQGGFTRLIGTIGRASTALIAFFTTNPVGIVLGAIILIGTALYLLVKHLDSIKEKMQGVSDGVIVLVSRFMPLIGVIMFMAKYWDILRETALNTWTGIRAYSHVTWIWLRTKVIVPLKNMFTNVWDEIRKGAKKFYDFIMQFKILKIILSPIVTLFEGIWNIITKIFDKITNANFFKDVLVFIRDISKNFKDSALKAEKEMVESSGNSQEKAKLYKESGSINPKPSNIDASNTTNRNLHATINVYTNKGEDVINTMRNLEQRMG